MAGAGFEIDHANAFDGQPVETGGCGGSRARRAANEALGDRIAEQAFHLDAALHRLLADLRAFDASSHWAEAGARSCASWLSWRVGWDPGTAREHLRVARALGELPLIDGALREGRLSYSKVRAITRVATPAIEAALLDDAHYTTAAQLEVICRALRSVQRQGALSADDVCARRMVTRRERNDGMVSIEAVLPADEAAIVFAAIEHEAARVNEAPAACDRAQDVSAGMRLDRADGLLAMCQAALRGDAPDRAPVEVVLTISRDALASTASTAAAIPAIGCLADGTGVSAETARRLACDCGVVHLDEDADGHPLSVGRRTRSIPTAIARALARRDTTCRFPGCTNRRFLDGHHLTHWIHGGATSLDNLCRLCPSHHRYVHERGVSIELRDGEPTFFVRGRQLDAEPPRVVTTPLGWPSIHAANADLDLDDTTGQCAWDGQPIAYGLVVDSLAHLARAG